MSIGAISPAKPGKSPVGADIDAITSSTQTRAASRSVPTMRKSREQSAVKKTNITLKLDAAMVREIKVIAATRGISVSAFVAGKLEEEVRQNGDYEQAMRRALALMKESSASGWQKTKSRDELHAR
jgi:predicted HicB family RNase H-like nuclease